MLGNMFDCTPANGTDLTGLCACQLQLCRIVPRLCTMARAQTNARGIPKVMAGVWSSGARPKKN